MEHVVLELVQLNDYGSVGRLLATYDENARDFLYPVPTLTPTYGSMEREILMERTIDFPVSINSRAIIAGIAGDVYCSHSGFIDWLLYLKYRVQVSHY